MGAFHQHGDEGHHDSVSTYNRAFLIAVTANGAFVLIQILFAFVANSTSLLADAVHNLGDVLGLMLAWVADRLLNRMPTQNTTYGMKKTSILAALFNGLLLVFTCGIIATEAMYKLFSPSAVHAGYVMIVAAIGIVVNGSTALLFFRRTEDLNIRGAFLHLLYDMMLSAGVVVSAALIYYTGWMWLDPLIGLCIALIILKGTWSLFTDSFRLIIDGVPRKIVISEVQALLSSQPGVQGVHDLHVWALSTQENALSVHLWMPEAPLSDHARRDLGQQLRQLHHIHHTTIQVERSNEHCEDACRVYI